jgi:hypothetical protein
VHAETAAALELRTHVCCGLTLTLLVHDKSDTVMLGRTTYSVEAERAANRDVLQPMLP